MFEKVNPGHPDKVADRIAGALVDMAYSKEKDPRIAVEVLIGHRLCQIIAETSVPLEYQDIKAAVRRITGAGPFDELEVRYLETRQDPHLAENQKAGFRCGDNGIFRGMPISFEQSKLVSIAGKFWKEYQNDGKYILDGDRLIVCQSHMSEEQAGKLAEELTGKGYKPEINPLGPWTGGINVDSGATNRKLGSDMGDAVTGGGLHGKDLSKADVSVNIYAYLEAGIRNRPVEMCCAIGDQEINGVPYSKIVETARKYIEMIGGFEKFAEWGLIRPLERTMDYEQNKG